MPIFRQVRSVSEISRLSEKVISELQKSSVLAEVGRTVSDSIRKRTRAGYGCDEDEGSRKKLAELAESTVKIRRSFSDLSTETRPEKSNLTMTGRMLNDLGFQATNKKVTILFLTQRSAMVSSYAHNGTSKRPARPFMFVTKTELREAVRILERRRDEAIQRFLYTL